MAHEDLTRDQNLEGSSDRNFGLVFAGGFLLIALLPLFHAESPRWWAMVVSAVFATTAMWNPRFLAGLNRMWTKLGLLLSNVISPIALGILFYVVLTPIGLVIRLTGKDPLRLRRDIGVDSYWVPREPPGPPPDSMTNQF
jgi:hypothetical protein